MLSHRFHAAPVILALAAVIGFSPPSVLASNGSPDPDDAAQGTPGGGDPTFEEIERPVEETGGAFIAQIGATNEGSVEQGSTKSYARIVQDGAQNLVELGQGEAGTHSARIAQSGDGNALGAVQDGSGQTALLFAQEGQGNTAAIAQRDTGESYSAAAVLQSGNANSLIFVQDGSDNQARLTQNGDNNTMTATQLNSGNRLEWTQEGSNLSGAHVEQDGNQTTYIYQSNTGAAFASGD